MEKITGDATLIVLKGNDPEDTNTICHPEKYSGCFESSRYR
ncbi:hypothetical protein [Mucilaginibacter sp. L196]|nr:hypothetical protein [Mucilaginibacter sp. L196]